MELKSSGPSKLFDNSINSSNTFQTSDSIENIKWTEEIDIKEGFSILEKAFYPFKQVCMGLGHYFYEYQIILLLQGFLSALSGSV